jgi:hypothetical protein
MTSDNKRRIGIITFSALLFCASLTQDAIIYNDFDGQKTHASFPLLIMGGLAILGGGLFEWLVWLANPLYILSIVLFIQSKKNGLILSVLSTLIGLSFLNWNEILAAESGRTAEIESLELGYWLWVSSLAALSIGIILNYLKKRKHNKVYNSYPGASSFG